MAKENKPLRSTSFNLSGSKPPAPLPKPEEVEASLSKLSGLELDHLGKALPSQTRRIPFTTSITPVFRARLEALANERRVKVADILHQALTAYFAEHSPQDPQLVENLLKIFEQR